MDAKTLTLFYQVTELRYRAEWTYKIQLSQAEKYHSRNNCLNILAIVLTGLSTLFAASGGIAQVIGCSNAWISFVAAAISGIGSILLACNQNLNYVSKIPQNIEMGAKIWRLYIDFESLIIDLFNGTSSYEQALHRRDTLLDQWTKLSEIAPLTFAEAVKKADKKINKRGDNDYSIEELLKTLPDYLRVK
ncbi:MAG TPA: hypothetical protein DD424_09275 [Porphyromonadaceae bacterium]|nr:hypothetical protein [Porphyromonadaceae bacterium]